jgi:hypothetical protein
MKLHHDSLVKTGDGGARLSRQKTVVFAPEEQAIG